MKVWLKKRIAEISFKTIVVLALFVLSLLVFAFLADEIVLKKQDLFDTRIFSFLTPYSSPAFIEFMKALSFFGSSYFLFPAYVVIVAWLLWKRKTHDAINVSILGISSFLLKAILKQVFQRERPDLQLAEKLSNFSFPSGHALSSFIFASVVIYLVWGGNLQTGWKWFLSVLLILFSFLVGLSRIVLRYHYASDVMAGFCIAFSWVILSFWTQNKITKNFRSQSRQIIEHK